MDFQMIATWTRIAVVAALLPAAGASAQSASSEDDLVKLKNGQEIVGRIIAEDERTVTVLFRGGEIVLQRRKIQDIVRGERVAVEQKAERVKRLARYESRLEYFYVFYFGRCVGWRETALEPFTEGEESGYRISSRTVFSTGEDGLALDVKVSETVDAESQPIAISVAQSGSEATSLVEGRVTRGFLSMRESTTAGFAESESLFPADAQWLGFQQRRLADATHFPDAGDQYKVYDPMARRFVRMHATRALRKEVVAGKHQYVTVWRLTSGQRSREVWIDGYGGVVREELGHANLVALRAVAADVLAFSRGEKSAPSTPDLNLEYENVPSGFKLARPNLTWSFEFPEPDGALSITLVNPTLQASVDVMVLDRVGAGVLPESVAAELIERMEQKSQNQKILYQKRDAIGGLEGVRFESTGDRKGVDLRSVGAIAVSKGRAYALLLAAPLHRFNEAEAQFDRILKSFEILDPDPLEIKRDQ